jgi:hypothetical protein
MTADDPLVVDSGELIGLDESALRIGEAVLSWQEPVLKVSKPQNDGTPDDVLQSHLGLPIFSKRLRDAAEAAGIADVQYLPVRVRRPNGVELTGFTIANVITRRSALDRARSDLEQFPDDYFLPERRGRIRALRTPVLLKQALDGCDVMRLEEFLPAIYVSERFKCVFEKHRLTGFSFHEVEVA